MGRFPGGRGQARAGNRDAPPAWHHKGRIGAVRSCSAAKRVRLLYAGTRRLSRQAACAINRSRNLGERAPGWEEGRTAAGLGGPPNPSPLPAPSSLVRQLLPSSLLFRPQLGFHGLSELQLFSLGAQETPPLNGQKAGCPRLWAQPIGGGGSELVAHTKPHITPHTTATGSAWCV